MLPANFKGAEGQLHAAASAVTGLTDFGDARHYLPGLTAFLNSLDDNGPRFKEGGREFVWNTLVGVLIARALTEQGLKDRPEVLKQKIKRPIIIIGVPRTGTTALHKILSMDPQFQGLDRWLTAFPMPRPAQDTWVSNPWYQACVKGLDAFFNAAPQMRAAHDMRAEDVDECLEVLKQSFVSNFYGSTFRAPNYDHWWLAQSEAPAYQRLYQVLQLIGANDPQKTWLLKNPGHVAQVGTLLDTFPDACVIQTHRTPVKALPSLCSVLAQARAITESVVDNSEIGEREITYWSNAVHDAMRVRERAPHQFLDIQQRDIQQNPMAVVERIYQHFDLTLSDQARQNMLARIAQAPESSHGEHHYSAADFGLDKERIEKEFNAYCQAYIPR